jgi:hypothetical protein
VKPGAPPLALFETWDRSPTLTLSAGTHAHELGGTWLQPCRHDSYFDSGPAGSQRINLPAAKRRKNTAHGASRGASQPHFSPPNCHLERSSFLAQRGSYGVERSLPASIRKNPPANPSTEEQQGSPPPRSVILRRRSPWQSQGLPTKDPCNRHPRTEKGTASALQRFRFRLRPRRGRTNPGHTEAMSCRNKIRYDAT